MLHLLSSVDDEELLTCNSMMGNVSKDLENPPKNVVRRQLQNFSEFSYSESIKVTIKEKPIVESKEYRLNLLGWAFQAFLSHLQRTKRLCELKIKTHERLVTLELKRHFRIWKSRVDERKKELPAIKNDLSDDQKIQEFVDALVEKQKPLRRVDTTGGASRRPPEEKEEKELMVRPGKIVESSLQKRLSFQKKIITEQRLKLVQQNQIIEEMRLKRLSEESHLAKEKTLTTARQVLKKCRQRTRSDLMQLMRTEGVDSPGGDFSRTNGSGACQTPDFIFRMEARAQRRRERLREAREKQRERLEIQRQQEEDRKKEEEEKQKSLKLEAQRRARRLLQEQRRKKIIEAERLRLSNEIIERFYRRYLLRNYILMPFVRILQEEKHLLQIADEHFYSTSLKRSFGTWKNVTRQSVEAKVRRCTTICNGNILFRFFSEWVEMARERAKKFQIAWDFYRARVCGRYLRAWYHRALEMKAKSLETLQFVENYYDEKMMRKYFRMWGTYTRISEDVNESDRQKEKFRALVQNVVPNFCPKHRGVIRD
ncbi:trichohyalin [Fopius arisanus]|uniref:Trichohyalin n=1 Tax=Fopius arisanus TaxID=64838 RepID=A0A9R1U3K0_9HYME|nr:PREDICTED: trichohyalin-like [Fopius arisanus]